MEEALDGAVLHVTLTEGDRTVRALVHQGEVLPFVEDDGEIEVSDLDGQWPIRSHLGHVGHSLVAHASDACVMAASSSSRST